MSKNIMKKEKIDKIKVNWDVEPYLDAYGELVELPIQQQLILHLLEKLEELELRIIELEKKVV